MYKTNKGRRQQVLAPRKKPVTESDVASTPAESVDLNLSVPPHVQSAPSRKTGRTWIRPDKVGLFFASIFLFVLAIILMKEGASDLAPLLSNHLSVDSMANSLGFGWLSAYLLMSGSPVAAAALTFLDAGAIDRLSAFMMINGSRLGAGFIVLFIGFIYVLRGRDRTNTLSMGLLALIVTGTLHLVGIFVGIALLQSEVFDQVRPQPGLLLSSVFGLIFDPIVDIFRAYLPLWALFLVGLAIIMVSFNLFDKCLPQMAVKESQVGHVSRLIYRPWVMFLLGAAITLISMSVTISLSILVPLSHRGFIRRENVIPYIMGTNVTTFIDTLLAAILLNNSTAVNIVLVEIASITLVSIVVLSTFYRRYQRAMLGLVTWITDEDRHLILFMTVILLIPILLILL